LVFGPFINETNSPKDLNMSTAWIRSYFLPPEKTESELLTPVNNMGYWADVRDVDAIHTLALGNPSAGGERFIVCSGPDTWQNFLDAVHTAYPNETGVVARGYPGRGKTKPGYWHPKR